jgi:hypothetical protein
MRKFAVWQWRGLGRFLTAHGVPYQRHDHRYNRTADTAANELSDKRAKVEPAGCIGRRSGTAALKQRTEHVAPANPAESTRYDIAKRPKIELTHRVSENAAAACTSYQLDDEVYD